VLGLREKFSIFISISAGKQCGLLGTIVLGFKCGTPHVRNSGSTWPF
jgi:hypothetical protein